MSRAWRSVFAALINHPRMDFILMRRHRRLVWPPRHATRAHSLLFYATDTQSLTEYLVISQNPFVIMNFINLKVILRTQISQKV